MNALKTGVFAKHLLLPDDNAQEFGRLRAALHNEWRPLGPSENSLVERLIALLWRQRRIYHAESGLYAMFRQCPDGLGGVSTALAKDGNETEAFTRILRMDRTVEQSISATIRLLQKLQKQRGKRAGLAERPPAASQTESTPKA
jgi:hypothetical protein